MRFLPRARASLLIFSALVCTPSARAATPALRGVAFPAASLAEADSTADGLGFERLVRTGPGWRVVSRLRNGSLLWYAAGHDSAFGGHGDSLAVPLFTGLKPGIDVGLPVGMWTPAESEAEAMPHPNGAVELAGVAAQVPDVDAACEAWRRAGLPCSRLPAGNGRESRTIALPGGGRIVLEPRRNPIVMGSHLPPKTWREPVTPHWTGVFIAVSDSNLADSTNAKESTARERQIRIARGSKLAGLSITFVLR